MSHRERFPGAGEPLTPEQAAQLGECGFDAAYIRRTAKTPAGLKKLAHMAELARMGALPPYDPSWEPNESESESTEDDNSWRSILLFWAATVPAVAVLAVFFLGCADLFSLMQGARGDTDFQIGPVWANVAMVVVPFLLLDVLMRWRGRRILQGAPGPRASDLQLRPSDLGFRPVPPVLQELVCLPILTLIPVAMVQDGSSHPIALFLMVVTLALLGATGVSMALAGGPVAATILFLAWAAWCWIAIHGYQHGDLATFALLLVTIAIMVVWVSNVMKGLAERDAKLEGGAS